MWKELFNNALTAFYFMLVRPMWKWLLHKYTGQCELLRITYRYQEGAGQTKRIESSLKRSGIPLLKQLSKQENIDLSEATRDVMKLKEIVSEVHPRFEACFKVCLCQICGYKKLLAEVKKLKQESYNSNNPKHEEKLMQLWTVLCPDQKLESRISKDWGDIGFQGDDPMTDFRGMGILGLDQLLYLATQHNDQSRRLLSHSKHPKLWYPYAVVGINLTSLSYNLLLNGTLRTHFYNISKETPLLEQFHEVYCYLFFEFDKFWFGEKPKTVMEFGSVLEKFRKKTSKKLKSDPSAMLVTDFTMTEES